jgi:DNA polymerase iota
MSHYQYFDELSGDSSDGRLSSDDDDSSEEEDETLRSYRTILHADVDCFYCQCEVMDRGLDPDRPLAIGQKHIVVTCNYAARAEGITKLMDRVDAKRRCPHLLIVEGSDLRQYRMHARKIYESFRRAIKAACPNSAVRKGSMDEMMAEISSMDLAFINSIPFDGLTEDIFLCNRSDQFQWTEDQSGAQVLVAPSRPSHLVDGTNDHGKLHSAALWAVLIRHTIWKETGFTTTLGVSFNPMMAKLAIGYHKPGIVNLLEPEPRYGSSFVESLPLRSIPGIGSRTMKALRPCLEKFHRRKGDQASSAWLCRYVSLFCGLSMLVRHLMSCFFVSQRPAASSSCRYRGMPQECSEWQRFEVG